jgi:hypothetical protein
MRTTEFIKKLSDRQLEIAFITLGVYFNKYEYLNTQYDSFEGIALEGMEVFKQESITLSNEFKVFQLMDLIKVEMFKRGIE